MGAIAFPLVQVLILTRGTRDDCNPPTPAKNDR
jgi:hypothetical protein